MTKQLAIIGEVDFARPPPTVAKANASHTLGLDDAGATLQCTNSSPVTLTIPANKTAGFPLNTTIIAFQDGTGKVSFAAASGVTLNSPAGNLGAAARYAFIWITKIDTDRWIAGGNLG